MLALVATLAIAVYVLGPDLFSRWVVAFFAPARVQSGTRSEEISRALFKALIPFLLVFWFGHAVLHRFSDLGSLRIFLNGTLNEHLLDRQGPAYFDALLSLVRTNFIYLIVPIYVVVLIWSLWVAYLIKNYGRLLRKYEKSQWLQNKLVAMVRPWTADWHLKLSGMLLERTTDYIQVDVLTKLDVLYRGRLKEHDLAPDGALVSITLENPSKFKRDELLAARSKSPGKRVSTAKFWSPIDGKVFVILADQIVTLNLNYVAAKTLKQSPKSVLNPHKIAALLQMIEEVASEK